MLHIPILRFGRDYESVDQITLMHHATGAPVARVSQANAGLIARDLHGANERVLEGLKVEELFALCRKAAELFAAATLPVGDVGQSLDDYVQSLSATTGMPVTYCRNNAAKVQRVLAEIDVVVAGLTRGLAPDVLDRGYGQQQGRMVSFFRAGRIFGAVLPSNSPGVHSLWVPAVALKAPLALKPGREEPWTPLRIIAALVAAGVPREAFGFYPTDHAGASELLRGVHRAMLFGDASTTRPWRNDPRVELHGPGYSKVILGPDVADDWERYVDVIASSIAANGGRSCINASAVWTPRHARPLAEALGRKLAAVRAYPADDPRAEVAAFANAEAAERIHLSIEQGLSDGSAVDLAQQHRGSPRLVREGRCAYLLPAVIHCDREHPLANREFLFPYASVIECPADEMPAAIGPTLVVSAITRDERLVDALMASANVDRLNIGAVPTWRISWDQPHEGNLFEHLYRQRAFQIEAAA